MHRLVMLLLLADIALIVFGRFSAAAAWLYYLLVVLLAVLAFLYYLTAFHINRRQWARAAGEADVQILTAASHIEGDAAAEGSWGFLGRAGSRFAFIARSGGNITEVVSFALSSVVSVEEERSAAHSLLRFRLADGRTVQFSLRNRRGSVREAVIAELGQMESFLSDQKE
jgi:uncharacterized membrane protein YuzA (DUF378 family)